MLIMPSETPHVSCRETDTGRWRIPLRAVVVFEIGILRLRIRFRFAKADAPLRMTLAGLLQALSQAGDRFEQIVVDDHDREQNQENEGGLIDALFDAEADVAAHHAFDEKE